MYGRAEKEQYIGRKYSECAGKHGMPFTAYVKEIWEEKELSLRFSRPNPFKVGSKILD